ncbi:MAG: hypothetical protein GXO87_15100 [Chlorobi bacterium]|nr:hypothetical protein [Chlorobiota bacterium]
MNIAIYEDKKSENFHPLSLTRPVFDLRCGIFTLREKIELQFPDADIILRVRNFLFDKTKENYPDYQVNDFSGSESILFINGRILADANLHELLQTDRDNVLFYCNDEIVAAKTNVSDYEDFFFLLFNDLENNSFDYFEKVEIEVQTVEYTWDLVNNNGREIVKDIETLVNKEDPTIQGKVYDGVALLNKKDIFLGEGSKIKPGVVLDAENGPIYIGKNVTIFPNAVIEGPCFIGNNSKIKIGAKIYENVSIGEVCKIGGEVEESIIHSYSNKQHDGFLGHSYLGSWVNLGADTNNSDLKNNYGNVKVTINDEEIDSGSMFVGLTMGDHSKTGINTMFNTGTVAGVCANIFGSDFPPKYIPSFSWGGANGFVQHDLEKALAAAEKVMQRRNVEFTKADEKALRFIFDFTSEERKKRNF